MADALISVGGAAVGGFTWFANKIFGPSADAIGEQLKAYMQSRIPIIFGVAATKAAERHLEGQLRPIPPGLLARLVSDASFSADEPAITDWWANILLDAALTGSSKHVVFSDIMAMLGPAEAACLRVFMESFDSSKPDRITETLNNMPASVGVTFPEAARHWLGPMPVTPDTIFQIRDNMLTGEIAWPLRPISWQFPFKNGDEPVRTSNMMNDWYRKNIMQIEVLERARILREYHTTITGYGAAAEVTAVAATPLGLDFYATCIGAKT